MKEQKIIETIKKCLALASNNPSEEEARAAALKAQQLLAKYNIALADVETIEKQTEEIKEEVVWFKDVVKGVARAWKYELADVVARNFRCKHFFYGKSGVCFYGHVTDAIAAAEVYKYLFAMGDRMADRAMRKVLRQYHNQGLSAKVSGIYNSWVKGFLAGLKSSFDAQSTALMIVVPEDVKEQYAVRSANFGHMNAGMRNTDLDARAYEEGKRVGKDAMAQRSLEV